MFSTVYIENITQLYLYLYDEYDHRNNICVYLKNIGYQIVGAKTAGECEKLFAVEIFAQASP